MSRRVQLDPVSGRIATATGAVRDPFGSCGPTQSNFDLTGCNLNQIPAGRLDPNAVKLLNLYPTPTNPAQFANNFTSSPHLFEHRNQFDVRVDFNPTQKDQIFVRFSYADDPQFIPGPFGGIADGGGFQQGTQTYKPSQAVAAYTHVFSPSTINVARVGFNHLHTTRFGPEGNTQGIPAQFGIQGIPQGNENGGLPAIVISGPERAGQQRLPAFGRSQPDLPGDGRLHEDLREEQLQDRHGIPECELQHSAAGVLTR